MPKTDSELFIDYLTETFGHEDHIFVEPACDGGPRISVFVYRDCPEPGMITGITYGLSLRAHPEWTLSRPEMVISIESSNIEWPQVALGFASWFASEKRFRYGDIFTVDGSLTSDTQMDAVLIFAQSILDSEDAVVQLNDYRVTLSQFYPIHRSEIPLYEKIGLEAFWHHPGFGMYDPKRPPISG